MSKNANKKFLIKGVLYAKANKSTCVHEAFREKFLFRTIQYIPASIKIIAGK